MSLPELSLNYPVNEVRAKDLAPVIDVFLKGDNIVGTKVFPFDGANILAVTASASQHKQLKEFFSSVDVSRIQVLVESVIFETSASDGFDFSFAAGDPSGHPIRTNLYFSATAIAGYSFFDAVRHGRCFAAEAP
ncbi:secretin N-terminal domain-containing protein [Erwinia tracheiphila]|uniref:secretin N-terminal domain-containing protein n=1 Tax=Erwinia tracheiphila TaxID=65700 RepID=UPI00300266B5